MNRKKLIKKILKYSMDEYESKQDFIDLAMKSKKQLREEIININNYYIINKL